MKIIFKPVYVDYRSGNQVIHTRWSSGNNEDDAKIDKLLADDCFGLQSIFDYFRSEYIVTTGSYRYDKENDIIIFQLLRKDGMKQSKEDRKKVEAIYRALKGPLSILYPYVLVDFKLMLVCECDA